jgi:hypothetical protein
MCAVIARDPTLKSDGRILKLHRGETFGEVSIAAAPIENGRKPPNFETGPAAALDYLIIGVAAQLPRSTASRRGARTLLKAAMDDFKPTRVNQVISVFIL